MQLEIQTYLLAQLAGGSTDPSTLANEARCISCMNFSSKQLLEIQIYLLCQIANA